MFVIFKYSNTWRYGELKKPEHPAKHGVRFSGTITNNAVGINIDGNILPLTDLQINAIIDDLVVYNKTQSGKILPGNTESFTFNKGEVFLEVVDAYPKSYNVRKISELQVSTSDPRAKWESLHAEETSV